MDEVLLWAPSHEFRNQSNLTKYIDWLRETRNLSFENYHSLWMWSVNSVDEFWHSIWDFFNILHDGSYAKIKSGDMPFTSWFEGTYLNYAEHIFRNTNDKYPAIVYKTERSEIQYITWKELEEQVAALQNFLRLRGLQSGDCVVGLLPCIPEATVAFLAVNSLGAIWSSCSPEFGTNAIIERFSQITPKALIAINHYEYNGKLYDKSVAVKELIYALKDTLQFTIVVGDNAEADHDSIAWTSILQNGSAPLSFTRVPFDHPIWVLYSSGTTGLPKAITHSHGGILLEQLKYLTFHNDYKVGDNCFWYTTTGWMMWNYIQGSLLTGATLVLYDGSPAYPDLSVLWKFAQDARIHHFGTSAGYILANMKAEIKPSIFNLTSLRSIGSTGSTLPPEGFAWIYKAVKENIWLASMSGGTDVCSAFVGGNPTLEVYAGEIQCRALGCNVQAYDEQGYAIENEVGEMVITEPMPSMPIYFWNDPEFKRYKESYFDMYPGIWRHGDWIKITNRKGIVIYGRSDATLNRGGVRIGTSEIYRAVDHVNEVKDSLIICIEKKDGDFWMPLFVVMKDELTLTDEIKKKISLTIREANSPRHVPDEIIAVPDIPYTISGKKTETPVKKVLMGKDPKEVINAGALKNPESIDFFIQLAKQTNC